MKPTHKRIHTHETRKNVKIVGRMAAESEHDDIIGSRRITRDLN